MNTRTMKGLARMVSALLLVASVAFPAAPAQAAPAEMQVAQLKISSEQGVKFNSADNTAVFTGNVVVTHPGFTMTSDRLVVFFNQSKNGLEKAVGTGFVTVR